MTPEERALLNAVASAVRRIILADGAVGIDCAYLENIDEAIKALQRVDKEAA